MDPIQGWIGLSRAPPPVCPWPCVECRRRPTLGRACPQHCAVPLVACPWPCAVLPQAYPHPRTKHSFDPLVQSILLPISRERPLLCSIAGTKHSFDPLTFSCHLLITLIFFVYFCSRFTVEFALFVVFLLLGFLISFIRLKLIIAVHMFSKGQCIS